MSARTTKSSAPFVVFNGGEIGLETLSRVTLENYAATAEIQENVWVDANGPMSLRPGLGFCADLGTSAYRIHRFVRSVAERFLLVMGDETLRVAYDGDIIARPTVSSTVPNGSFATGGVEYISGATLTASSTSADTTAVVSTSGTGAGELIGGGSTETIVVTGGAVANLKDGNVATHWMSDTTSTAWVKIDVGSAQTVTRLTLTAATAFGRYAPVAFTFQGSATGAFAGEQTTLLTVSGISAFSSSEVRRWAFANATAYRYYRLNMTSNGNDGTIGSYIDGEGATIAGSSTGYYRLAEISLPDLQGWTDVSTSGGSATITGGRLLLNSNGSATAGVRQSVATSSAGTMHALEIHIHHGPVKFKCGSSAGGQQYISERELRTGHHSLAFTPTGTYYVEFTSTAYRQVEVESIQIAGAGDMVLDTPWASEDLQSLRFHQTLNVMYVAVGTAQQRRIERWDNNSWSVTKTNEIDGPFADPNTDETLTLTPSVRVGAGTLTASRALFQPGHVGALFRITQAGQFESRTISAADQWSEAVQVQGVGASRAVTFTVGAGLTGTVRIQRSIGNTSSWADASTSSSTSGGVTIVTAGGGAAQAFNDGLDNNNVYYRVGVKTGEYTSGSATVTIYYPFATTQGIVRVTNYTSETVVSMEVLENLAVATASSDWEEGAWSDYRGWPRAMAEFDGRMWALRSDKFWGSFSGSYESHAFDEGNSSAIARDVAVGAANEGQWIMGLGRLIIGTEGAEVVVRSNAFDEPLSTTNMTVREMSTYGVGNVQPIKVDTRCLYVDSSGFHLMEIVYNVQLQDYVARPLTTLHRDVGRPGIVQLDVMRRPDSRVLAVRSDGQCLIKLFDPSENVLGWGRWTTPGASGLIESVAVLPGGNANQDEVYFIVNRTIGGTAKRYLEKLAPVYYASKTEAYRIDSHVVYSGAATTSITGLSHLNGETVLAWADGYYAGEFVVSGGGITLGTAASNVVVGLDYDGLYKSSKLAFGAQQGTALAQKGRPNKVAFILRKAIAGGIEFGQSFTRMDRLKDRANTDPLDSGPALVTTTTDALTVPGNHNGDPRICIRMNAPYPGWIDGFVIGEEMNERVT